jgi:HCOMODA/2-hydroxy-3-carboxy-muconic semialdehyde decarboxylase
VNYLTPGEGEKADKTNFIVLDRIWNLWKMRILPALAK